METPALLPATSAPPAVGGSADPGPPQDLATPARPAILAATLLALVSAWLAATFLPAPSAKAPGQGLASSVDVDLRLAAAAAEPRARSVVLLGDSVMAGTMLGGRGLDRPERWTVPAQLADLAAPQADVGFHDLSSPGLLPADALAILDRLDALDPRGRVEVVWQLSPRAFSKAYARPASGRSLEFLTRTAAPALPGFAALTAGKARLAEGRGGLAGLAESGGAAVGRAVPGLRSLLDGDGPGGTESPATYRLRVKPHFLDLDLGGDSFQVAALRSVLGDLSRRARRALLFLTPLDESFLGGDDAADALREARITIGRLVEDGERVRLVDLDTAGYTPDRFLDHCHLSAEGNQVLALQLLSLLGVPARAPVPLADRPDPDWPDFAYVTGGGGRGSADGHEDEVRYLDPRDLAVVGPGILAVADTGNHVVRKVRVARRTSERWAGKSGEAGHADGGPDQARFDRPARVVGDGHGGAFVLDAGTGTVRRVGKDGSVRSVPPYDRPEPARPDRVRDVAVADGHLLVLESGTGRVIALPVTGTSVGTPFTLADLAGLDPVGVATDTSRRLWVVTAAGEVRRTPWKAGIRADRPAPLPPTAFDRIGTPGGAAGMDLAAAAVRGEQPQTPGAWGPAGAWRVLPGGPAGGAVVLDRWYGQDFAWQVDGRDGLVAPLVPARSDGTRLVTGDPGLFGDAVATVDPATGDLYWLHRSRSYILRWPAWTRRLAWGPGSGSNEREAAGDPRPLRRVLLLGNSLAEMEAGSAERSSRLGFPEDLRRRLAAHPSLAGWRIDLVRRIHPGQDLVEYLAALAGWPETRVDLVAFLVDRHSLADLPRKVRRTRWGPDGLPVTARHGPRSVPLAAESEATHEGDGGLDELSRVLRGIAAWSARRRVPVVAVDLLSTADIGGFGISVGPERVGASLSDPGAQPALGPLSFTYGEVRMGLEQAGIPRVDPGPALARELPWASPLNGVQDDHFRPMGHRLLAEVLADALAPRIAAAAVPRSGGQPRAVPSGTGFRAPDLPGRLDEAWRTGEDRLAVAETGAGVEVVLDVTGQAPARAGPSDKVAWGRAVWAAVRFGGDAGEAPSALEVRLVEFTERNEYGKDAWASARTVARYRVEARDRARAAEDAGRWLAGPQSAPPPWLKPTPGGKGAGGPTP